MKNLFTFLLLFILTNCASTNTLKVLTAGSIGCSPSDIKITDKHLDGVTMLTTWKATCKGHIFYCTEGAKIRCKEELK